MNRFLSEPRGEPAYACTLIRDMTGTSGTTAGETP